MTTLQAIKYTRGRLEVLDQLRLPHEFVYDNVSTCEEAYDCIKAMRVRGAPAIAIVAALALAVELENKSFDQESVESQLKYINSKLDHLMGSRPTAVDLANAIRLLKVTVNVAALTDGNATNTLKTVSSKKTGPDASSIRMAYILAAEKILENDLTTNLAIGRYGAEYLRRLQMPVDFPTNQIDDDLRYFTTSPPGTQGAPDRTYRKLSVLTHCNTGSLATSGHGTALGIIRSLCKMNYLDHAYCTETRPYNQGSRLTAFELVYENIPATLITDSMAGSLFSRLKEEKNISAVIVGADRVARNGDTANKIGTYSLAVLAKYHGIKFVVAAPTTSIDLETETGDKIKIEDRAKHELTQISGAVVGKDGKVDVNNIERVAIAHQGIDVWNPSFDVTPHALIDAIVTEKGEIVRSAKGTFDFSRIMPERWQQQVEQQSGNAGPSVTTLSSLVSPSDIEDGTLFKMEHV